VIQAGPLATGRVLVADAAYKSISYVLNMAGLCLSTNFDVRIAICSYYLDQRLLLLIRMILQRNTIPSFYTTPINSNLPHRNAKQE
jgi:hypothetical protein